MTGNRYTEQALLPHKREISAQVNTEITPEAATRHMLIKNYKILSEVVEAYQKEHKHRLSLLTFIASEVYKKVISGKEKDVRTFEHALVSEGVEIYVFNDVEVTDEIMERVEVIEWKDAVPGRPEHVCETFEPEIRVHGKPVHFAKVVCRKEYVEAGPVPTQPAETQEGEVQQAGFRQTKLQPPKIAVKEWNPKQPINILADLSDGGARTEVKKSAKSAHPCSVKKQNNRKKAQKGHR